MAEQLSDDLVIEILWRLPIKSLHVFKCVSKSWYSLISDVCIPRILSMPFPLIGFFSDFKTGSTEYMDYLPYSDDEITSNSSVINDDGLINMKYLAGVLPSIYRPYHVVDCCNGLVLLVSGFRYYVCNPAIKQFDRIPIAHTYTHSDVILAFDPRESLHYKVIYFFRYRPYDLLSLNLFSSETRKWIWYDVTDPLVDSDILDTRQSVYLDGMLYRLSSSNHLVILDLNAIAITAQAIDLPDTEIIRRTEYYEREIGSIGVSKGDLHYANCNSFSLQIWQLNKDGFFWILKHSVCISGILDVSAYYNRLNKKKFKPIKFHLCAIHPSLDIVFLGIWDGIFSYHFGVNKLKLLWRRSIAECLNRGKDHRLYPYSHCFDIVPARDIIKPSESESLVLKVEEDRNMEMIRRILCNYNYS